MKKKTNTDIIYLIIVNIVRILFTYEILAKLIISDYTQMLVALMGLIGTFVPYFINNVLKVKLLKILNISIILFIFGAQYLGSLKNVYDIIKWWDTLLHMASGAILCLVGINIIKTVDEKKVKKLIYYPMLIVAFAFCFSVTLAVFWEFYEFASDRLIGTNMQLFRYGGDIGLVDTMIDLLSGTAGALITSVIGYIHYRNNKENLNKGHYNKEISKNKKEEYLNV